MVEIQQWIFHVSAVVCTPKNMILISDPALLRVVDNDDLSDYMLLIAAFSLRVEGSHLPLLEPFTISGDGKMNSLQPTISTHLCTVRCAREHNASLSRAESVLYYYRTQLQQKSTERSLQLQWQVHHALFRSFASFQLPIILQRSHTM